jgi:pentose-5-phosphate-3-epimerase
MDHVMDRLDIVLLMSVNPGFGGQKFIPSTLPKLREARARIRAHEEAGGQPIWLEVDGGVKTDNIRAIVAGGGRHLCGRQRGVWRARCRSRLPHRDATADQGCATDVAPTASALR